MAKKSKYGAIPTDRKWKQQNGRIAVDKARANDRSTVPLVSTKTVKAEGVGGWGFDPTWAGSKAEGLNRGEDRINSDLDRKRKDDKRLARDYVAPIVKRPRITRVQLSGAIGKVVRGFGKERPVAKVSGYTGTLFPVKPNPPLVISSPMPMLYPHLEERAAKVERPTCVGPMPVVVAPSSWEKTATHALSRLRGK
jgi:hypothetical protein